MQNNCTEQIVQSKVREICEIRAMSFRIFTVSRDCFVRMKRHFHVLEMLTILCYVVWCMDVAVPDTEEENTAPLQSPQLS